MSGVPAWSRHPGPARAAAVLGTLAALALLTACTGFPAKPKPAALPAYAPLDGMDFPSGGRWPTVEWWKAYQDPTLDRLIEMAIGTSPTLATAHARYETARQSVLAAGAATGVHVEAESDYSRQRLSDNGLFPPALLGFHWYDIADLGVQATYTFDWWGKQHDAIEAAVDQAHAAEAERSAAALTLASSIADTYFGWQSDQARLALARERLRVAGRRVAIARERMGAELESADAGDDAERAAAAIREQAAGLEGSARLRVVALAALLGRPASELPALTPRSLPVLPEGVPDDVRIDLLARRADITASRWRVEAAERNVAEARAEFFPDISINALVGVQSRDLGTLLQYSSRVPLANAAIHLPIFDAGRLKARYGASQAGLDSAVAGYRDTLVQAAREVAAEATSRSRIESQRRERAAQVAAAERILASNAARVRQGLSDERPELDASSSLLEQRDAMIQLDAAAVSADIGLKRALGGGFEQPRELADLPNRSNPP